jgi:hypothetical protein
MTAVFDSPSDRFASTVAEALRVDQGAGNDRPHDNLQRDDLVETPD